jgi:hypothetical protein
MVSKRATNISSFVEEVNYTVSNDTLDIEPEPVYNEPEQIRVRSRFPAHLKYIGQATGKLYEWAKPGDIVSVEAVDAPDLIQKILGSGACCGASQQGNQLFELA